MSARSQQLTYFVDGMDCASCVAKVERMVQKLPGTAAVSTSFNRQTLTLELNEALTPRHKLEGNLSALGYSPSLLSSPAQPLPQAPTAAGLPAVAPAPRFSKGKGKVAASAAPLAPVTPRLHPERGLRPRPADTNLTDTAPAALAAAPALPQPAQAAVARPWFLGLQGRQMLLAGSLLLLAWLFGLLRPELAGWGYTLATLSGVWPLARKAWAAARLGDPFSINLLVSVAACGAVLLGQAAEGAVVVFLFMVGEWLEGVAAGRARAGIRALSALAPRTALLLEAGATQAREVPAESLQIGQVVQVGPGARVPADGVILSGMSSLDDSPVTGESLPVEKGAGASVYAGSINLQGVLTIEVQKAAHDNTIARIIQLVEEAEASKAPTARLIDRFSRWYTPGVLVVSALVAVLPPLLLGQSWHPWLYKGVALLLIGCPCALVLSVPAAITSGLSAGTRRGLLVKGGVALEKMSQIKTVAFDKTGTLTAGQPRVTDILPAVGVQSHEVVRLAAAVERGSHHPLAQAIEAQARTLGLSVPLATDAQAQPGQGVRASVEGRLVWVHSPSAAAAAGVLAVGQSSVGQSLVGQSVSQSWQTQIEALEHAGKTVVVVHDAQQVTGLIALRDEPRADAQAALQELRRLGLRSVMLTGDNSRAAQQIAENLGLEAAAELLPQDKLRWIDQLSATGGVAMVGDGINDAPALARADVGIAMGSGTDVALETADAALLQGRVQGVSELVQLSRATMTNIRQNIALALGLKLIFLLTTLLGYTNLWMAVLADTGATALVTANALRLLAWTPPQWTSRQAKK